MWVGTTTIIIVHIWWLWRQIRGVWSMFQNRWNWHKVQLICAKFLGLTLFLMNRVGCVPPHPIQSHKRPQDSGSWPLMWMKSRLLNIGLCHVEKGDYGGSCTPSWDTMVRDSVMNLVNAARPLFGELPVKFVDFWILKYWIFNLKKCHHISLWIVLCLIPTIA